MLKLLFICSLCGRREEVEAIESNGNFAEAHVHAPKPDGWSERNRREDHLHKSHGDVEPQTRFFCKPPCRTAWAQAEAAGIDAFREVMRKAGLNMRGAVDALADVAYESPPALATYEPPPVPEEELPF